MTAALAIGSILAWRVIAIAVAMAIYHIWAIAFGTPEAILFRGTHLLFALVLVFLIYRCHATCRRTRSADERQRRRPAADILDYVLLVAGGGADRLSVRQLRIHRHPHLSTSTT